jgi:DNA-directed RNA polymerase subunit H (RpoH/RPB5)
MESKSIYLSKLYKSRNNIIYYLKEMGYDCASHEHFSMEELDVLQKNEGLDFMVVKGEEKCYVKYMTEDANTKNPANSVKKLNISNIIDDMFMQEGILTEKDTLVLITNEYSVDSIHKALKNIWELKHLYVVLFDLKQLQLNVLKHKLVPKHTKLNPSEKVELYRNLNIEEDAQLPEISRFDPVAKTLFLRPGEVCRITRFDKISYTNDYYRVCIS